MVNFLQLSEEVRRQLIGHASTQSGTSVQAIEKDWWITLTLQALFSLPMSQHFIFKGGTSLSKGWKLIERFSEDIDIALAPEAFDEKYEEKPTHSYVKRIKRAGCSFTTNVIREALQQQFLKLGVSANTLEIIAEAVSEDRPDKDPQTLFVYFPSLYAPSYLTEPVKIEFGVRALREPFTIIKVNSMLSEFTESPAYEEAPFPVTAVEPRKTFMEKLLLLHEKFQTGRATEEACERQSRHLSDLLQMKRRGILDQVLQDLVLYSALIEHRRHYIRLKDVNYDTMGLQQLLFLPPVQLLDSFRQDYETMREVMIYGNAPDFDGLLLELRELNLQLVSIGHNRKMTEIIEQAFEQIHSEKLDGDIVLTTVISATTRQLPGESGNSTIYFDIEFIKTPSGFMLHRICVQ